MRAWAGAGISCVFLSAVVFQFLQRSTQEVEPSKSGLRSLLTKTPSGWTAEDIPIGDTEVLREAVSTTLRFDDYVFRRYSRGGVEFTLYVAYWRHGKHPPQMITQHVPDRCWTLGGMSCEEMRFNVVYPANGVLLWPAQWRKFKTPDGREIYTVFWHLIGRRAFDFGEQFYDVPSARRFWFEAARYVVEGQQEQYFVRVTANVPPEQIWSAGVAEALSGLVDVGLKQSGS